MTNTLNPNTEGAPATIGLLTEKQYTRFALALYKRIRGMVDEYTRVAIIPASSGLSGYSHIDILIDQDSSHSCAELARTIVRQRHKLSKSYTVYFYKSVNSQEIPVYLHAIEPEVFDFAMRYKAFNCLGAVVGVLAKHAGFCLSPHGLTYIKPGTPAIDTNDLGMLVTREWSAMLRFLGYSPKQYQLGFEGEFKNPEFAYEFAARTSFFSKAMFEQCNVAPESADENEQTALRGFIEWLNHPNQADIYLAPKKNQAELADLFLERAKRQFPDFDAALKRGDNARIDNRKAVDQVTDRYDRDKLKSDADITSTATLRTAIKILQREHGGREGFDAWLLSTTYDALVARIAMLKAQIEAR